MKNLHEKLSKSELDKREDIIMNMKKNKRELVKKYGKDAEAVMYGRATNIAKQKTESMKAKSNRLTELIKDALQNPQKADLDKDGKLSDYEKTRGAAIEKNLKETLDDDVYDKVDRLLGVMDDNMFIQSLIRAMSTDDAHLYLDAIIRDHIDIVNDGEVDINEDKVDEKVVKGKDGEKYKKHEIKFDNVKEDLDLGHEDNEPHMLKADLYRVGKYAMELYNMIDKFDGAGEVDFPSWWQAKVFKAKDALVGAKHYLDFELKEPQIDAVVDVAIDAVDEAVLLKDRSQDFQLDYLAKEKYGVDFKELSDARQDIVRDMIDDIDDDTIAEKSNVKERISKVLEGLPKGFWDKKIDAKDEDQDGKVDENSAFDGFGDHYSKEDKEKLALLDDPIEEKYMSQMKSDTDKMDQSDALLDDPIEEVGGYDRKGKKVDSDEERGMKKRPQAGVANLFKEDYDSLVKKIRKQGKSKKAAKAIAGAVASYKAKGGGKGPTAKQK
jgi:hypothetical protein